MKKRSNNAQAMKDRIFEAFSHCIYEYGLGNSTIRTIANEASVTPYVVQYYFKNKENLMNEFMIDYTARVVSQIRASFSNSAPPEKKLQNVFEDMRKTLKESKTLNVVCDLYPESRRNAAIREISRGCNERIIETLQEVIEEGVQKNVFNGVDSRTVAKTLLLFTFGYQLYQRTLPKRYDSEIKKDIDFFIGVTRKMLVKNDGLAKNTR